MRSLRTLGITGTALLLAAVATAHAALTSNSPGFNALTSNAGAFNALTTTGSAVADLNGVAVEAITLPPATHR
jgi:methionine-rich copper-binding protein CopC